MRSGESVTAQAGGAAPARVSTDRPDRPDPPALAVAAVARRLGVAPSTLRTWDRRYGLGPSEHSAGSHRRYTNDDVARLLLMRQLTLAGVAPADAARSAREPRPAAGSGPPAGGADRVATPSLLVEAAMRGDEPGCRRLLASTTGDVTSWWTELVQPARASLAARTVLARAGEEPEWVLESAALGVLRDRPGADRRQPLAGQRLVLLLAAPRERRPLALHVLAAALAAGGVEARVITGPVDLRRVLELTVMAHPVALAVVTETAAPDLDFLLELKATVPDLPLFVGVGADAAPAGRVGAAVQHEPTFAGLLREVLAVGR
jgi:DNA-binding transcriptional MerR regulator